MKAVLLPFFIFFISFFIVAQEFNPVVDELILETNLDSLNKYIRELTGEDSVMVNGNMHLLQNRIYDQNDTAAEYIKQKLTEFGLNPIEQEYSSDGKNIYAIQEGSLYPDEQYIICAHYDAVADYCADDNASGCVAVLEAARLLSNLDFEYTIIYAFWDEEEIGIIGSAYYASEASQNNDQIKGVINLEMFGWDSNNDMEFDIHTQNYANSVELADLLVDIDETYNLLLEPVIYNPGTTASDHSSFWNEGYGAVVFSEAFFCGDGNPYYHTSQDRVEHFNQPYFHELSKLAVGTIATLANPIITSLQSTELVSNDLQLLNFPNPFRDKITIAFNLPKDGNVSVLIYDYLGNEIFKLSNKHFYEGDCTVDFQNSSLPKGIYFVRLETDFGITTSTIVKQ